VVNRNVVITLALTAIALLALLGYLQISDTKGQQALVLKDADTITQIEVFAPDIPENHQLRQASSGL